MATRFPLTQPIATRPGVIDPTAAVPAPVLGVPPLPGAPPPTSPAAYAAAIPPQQGVPPLPPQPGMVPPPPGMMPPPSPYAGVQPGSFAPPMGLPSPQMMQSQYSPVPHPEDAQRAAMAQQLAGGFGQAPPMGQPAYLPTAAGGGALPRVTPTIPTGAPGAPAAPRPAPAARTAASGGSFSDPAVRSQWTSTRPNAAAAGARDAAARPAAADARAGFRAEWSRLSAEEKRRRLRTGRGR